MRRGVQPISSRACLRSAASTPEAMAGQFSKVRSFVFIDGIDEVTEYFKATEDIAEAVHRVNTEADVIWVDGHSDYGHAFDVWNDRHFAEITPKTAIILLGDARNNYHASQTWVVDALRKRGRHVPEAPPTSSKCRMRRCRNGAITRSATGAEMCGCGS